MKKYMFLAMMVMIICSGCLNNASRSASGSNKITIVAQNNYGKGLPGITLKLTNTTTGTTTSITTDSTGSATMSGAADGTYSVLAIDSFGDSTASTIPLTVASGTTSYNLKIGILIDLIPGGSWYTDASHLRLGYVYYVYPTFPFYDEGFRLLLCFKVFTN